MPEVQESLLESATSDEASRKAEEVSAKRLRVEMGFRFGEVVSVSFLTKSFFVTDQEQSHVGGRTPKVRVRRTWPGSSDHTRTPTSSPTQSFEVVGAPRQGKRRRGDAALGVVPRGDSEDRFNVPLRLPGFDSLDGLRDVMSAGRRSQPGTRRPPGDRPR